MNPAGPASRRRLLGMSLAAGAAAVAGCGQGTPRRIKVNRAVAAADVRILNSLLLLERRAIDAYTAGIPLLSGQPHRAATVFLRQELEHTGLLLRLIDRTRGRATPRQASYDVGSPRTPNEVLRLLHRLERAQLAAYVDAIPHLSPGYVRASVATILADDAQHVSVLRSTLGLTPMPSAFVDGRE